MKLPLALTIFATALETFASTPETQSNALTVVAVLQDDEALAGAHDIEVRDGLAYLAGKGGALAIVEVNEPAMPMLLWSARDPLAYEDAQTVLPLGRNRLLVGTRDLILFDTRQPANPTLLATVKDRPRIDRINGFARRGDTVFGANKGGYVFAADVSGLDDVRVLGVRAVRERDKLYTPHDVALADEWLVVVDGGNFGRDSKPGKLAVFRVADPATHTSLSPDRWAAPAVITDRRFAGANRVRTSGRFAYVASSLAVESPRHTGLQNNLTVVDLSDPMKPRVRGSIAFSEGRGPNGMEISGRVVFAAGGQSVQAIDVSDPDAPRELAFVTALEAFRRSGDDGHDLAYADGYLFVTAQNSNALVILRVEGKELMAAARR